MANKSEYLPVRLGIEKKNLVALVAVGNGVTMNEIVVRAVNDYLISIGMLSEDEEKEMQKAEPEKPEPEKPLVADVTLEKTLTADDIAAALRVSRNAVLAMARDGRLPAPITFGVNKKGGIKRWCAESFNDFLLNSQSAETNAGDSSVSLSADTHAQPQELPTSPESA